MHRMRLLRRKKKVFKSVAVSMFTVSLKAKTSKQVVRMLSDVYIY